MNEYVDLHTHTTMSDGTLTPSRVVQTAKSNNLRAIAVTDHDTVAGISQALKAGYSEGLEVIPGTELSIEYDLPDHGHMHMLGLFIDHESDALDRGLSWLRKKREERTPKILRILKKQGLTISLQEVNEEAGKGSVGRPHIARLLVRKGYVSDMKEAFEDYLQKGAVAYVPKEKFQLQHAINLIRHANGIPILAHPYSLNLSLEELEELIVQLKDMGLLGIEVYYSHHTEEQTISYIDLAKKHHLLISGGTDFHGENKPEIHLGTGLGNLRIPYSLVREMKKVVQKITQ